MTKENASGMFTLHFQLAFHAHTDAPAPTLEPSFQYGGSFLLNAVQAIQQQDNAAGGPCDELQQYLKAGAETTTDIVGWWGVSPAVCIHFTHI
jgi:hypothetical protein